MPPLVSLIENALKHGPRAGHRGKIAIRVTAIPRGVRSTVTNPGPFAPAETGRGLALLEKRVALHGNAQLTVAADGDTTRAVLELAR